MDPFVELFYKHCYYRDIHRFIHTKSDDSLEQLVDFYSKHPHCQWWINKEIEKTIVHLQEEVVDLSERNLFLENQMFTLIDYDIGDMRVTNVEEINELFDEIETIEWQRYRSKLVEVEIEKNKILIRYHEDEISHYNTIGLTLSRLYKRKIATNK